MRAELESIFHTSRTDSMTRSLKRAGYQFATSGRGATYSITITGLPHPAGRFEEFAKREFTCGPQTRIDEMERFFSLLFFHPDFRYYPANYQAKLLKEEFQIEVSDQTLRNWKKKLIDLGWIAHDDMDCRYFACRKSQTPEEIDVETYKKAWREFYSRIEDNENLDELRKEIYHKYNGMPRKQQGFVENAIERQKLDEFKEILDDSLRL